MEVEKASDISVLIAFFPRNACQVLTSLAYPIIHAKARVCIMCVPRLVT